MFFTLKKLVFFNVCKAEIWQNISMIHLQCMGYLELFMDGPRAALLHAPCFDQTPNRTAVLLLYIYLYRADRAYFNSL